MISSLEYYRAGHRHLTPDGVMMQWVPFGARESEIKDHIRTFAAEFSEVLVVRGAGGYGFYMLGSDAADRARSGGHADDPCPTRSARGHLVCLRLTRF